MSSKVSGWLWDLMGALVILLCSVPACCAANVVIGVNVVNVNHLSVVRQNDMLKAIKSAGVTVIRSGIPATDDGVDFARRAYAMGIRIDWIVSFLDAYQVGAPTRTYQKSTYSNMWSGHPLSALDPDLFKAKFSSVLAKLDAAGVKLEAMEIGNEINMAGFNPDFPVPSESRQFSLEDLEHDPGAQQIAKGYLQYLKILAQVKNVRDHTRVNRTTPILTAGFGAYEGPEGPLSKHTPGLVSLNATLDFLRAHGLDQWVDGYAVHVYPWSDHPGDPLAAAGRRRRLAQFVLARCHPPGSEIGKPCWITEWGFKLQDTMCPVNDSERVTLVREMMGDFKPYVEQGRLKGLIYFGWNTDPWAKSVDPFSLYQCGSLTASGRLALDPSLLQ
ncbi:hypothetical protein [Rhodanobacter geophilus]|uniref:Asl1-like glycosyl hydrolase catalytic domain-containing protein n=1 Tax=Rhodanobacter geophilus TaxID=3162488 RepID=A0ABV3QPI8_9GAMM